MRFVPLFTSLFAIAVLSGVLAACSPSAPAPGEPVAWTMAVTGDTVLSRRVERDTFEARDYTHAFGDLVPFMKSIDVFMTNLECQISDRGEPMDKGEARPFHFRAHPLMVNALKETGIDIVTVANNHGMDYGWDALLQTIDLCRRAGITVVGGGRNAVEAAAPGFVEGGGNRILFIGFQATATQLGAGPFTPGVNAARHEESDHFVRLAKNALEAVDEPYDLAMITIHWGPNYRTQPTDKQRDIARRLIDAGYDGVLCHSAHQFLGVELHQGKPIIHDAGNFICDFLPVEPHWNDRNIVFVLHYDGTDLQRIECVPIFREGQITNHAEPLVAQQIAGRFMHMCNALGTETAINEEGRVVIEVGSP